MQLSITLIIIIITCIVSILGFNNPKIIDELIFYPPAVSKRNQAYRFITCGLIHADLGHLFFNMLSLYFFGGAVEGAFDQIFSGNGTFFYILLYVSALVVSLLPTYLKNKENYYYRSLGASGAVSAIIFAGLMIAPDSEVFFFLIPIPIPGFIFAPLYLIISALLERKGGTNINHSAHIFGALYGVLFIIIAGKLAGFDAVSYCIQRVRMYMQLKGWI